MKRAKNGAWIIENGTFFGVSTGFEFAAEHECGMQSLQNSAGIKSLNDVYLKSKRKKWFSFKKDKPLLGLERTTILNRNNVLQGEFELDDGSICYAFGYNTDREKLNSITDIGETLETYWDNTSFLILSKDKDKMYLLVEAALTNDLAFTTGGKVLDTHAGIRMVIKSKTPQYIIDTCEYDDSKALELKEYDDISNVHNMLRKNKCEFYACSIHWKNYDTKEIHWWLNPKDQQSFESGFCTYEDLKDWTKGKGIVIKNK